MDRRIFVVGFGLYGSIHGPTEYQVNLQVIHTASGKVCGSNDTSFSCDGSNYTFRVMFKEPVEIHPNTSYTASTTLKVRVVFFIYFLFSAVKKSWCNKKQLVCSDLYIWRNCLSWGVFLYNWMKCCLLLIAVVNFLSFIIFFTITATAIAKEIVSETGQQFPVYIDCTSYIPVTNCTSYISIKSWHFLWFWRRWFSAVTWR